MTTPTRRLRAACYVRMSSDQQADSPEQQRARLTALAKSRGYEIVGWYQDSGISGLTARKRPDFQRMLADAEAGAFDVLLAWDQDRLSRQDSMAAGEWGARLHRAGVRMETIVQGVIDLGSFAGRIQFALNAEIGNQYSVKLSQVTSRGKFNRAKEGRLGPQPLYGFDRVILDEGGRERDRVPYGRKFSTPKAWSSRRVIAADPSAPNVVREIFARFVSEGVGTYTIAADLDERGVPSPRGKAWSTSTVELILTNPAYAGMAAYGRFPSGKLTSLRGGDGEPGPVLAPFDHRRRAPAVVVEGTHDPIVGRDVFDAAQAKLAALKASKRRPRGRTPFLLSGLVHCGETGRRLKGSYGSATRRDPSLWNRYYRRVPLGSVRMNGDTVSIRADELEGYVLDLLTSAVLSDRAFAALRQKVERVAARRCGRDVGRPDEAERKIAALDAKIRTATERLLTVDADMLDDAKRMVAGWRTEREKLRAEIAGRGKAEPAVDVAAVVEKAIGLMRDLRQVLDRGHGPELRGVVGTFVNRIDLWWRDAPGYRGRVLTHGVVELACLPPGGSFSRDLPRDRWIRTRRFTPDDLAPFRKGAA